MLMLMVLKKDDWQLPYVLDNFSSSSMNNCSGLLAADWPLILLFNVFCMLSKKPRLWIDIAGATDKDLWLFIHVLDMLWIMRNCLEGRWLKARDKKGDNILSSEKSRTDVQANQHLRTLKAIWQIFSQKNQTQILWMIELWNKIIQQKVDFLCGETFSSPHEILAMKFRPFSPKNTLSSRRKMYNFIVSWPLYFSRNEVLLALQKNHFSLHSSCTDHFVWNELQLSSCQTPLALGSVMKRLRKVCVSIQMTAQLKITAANAPANWPKTVMDTQSNAVIAHVSIGSLKPSARSVIETPVRTSASSEVWSRTWMWSMSKERDLVYSAMKKWFVRESLFANMWVNWLAKWSLRSGKSLL